MKKSLMFGTALAAVLALTAGTPAKAVCGGDQLPLVHGFGAMITGCKDALPVGFYAYQLGAQATANSNGQDGICEAEGVVSGINQTCAVGPGVAGDGIVAIQYDWGNFNPQSVGCPAGTAQGQPQIVSQVTCNDGKGALIAVGYEGGFGGYEVDLAFPDTDGDGLPNDIQAELGNTPIITSVSAGPSPSASFISVHLNPTHVFSDCTGAGAGFSCTGPAPSVGIGRLYLINAPCGSSPDPRLTAWTLSPVQPDLSGNAINIPVNAPTGCMFVGASSSVGGVETVAVSGSVQVKGTDPAASTDKVKIDKASFDQGKLLVGFSTINETSIVGFNVYAGSTKLNSGLVQAKGTGSNTYSYEAARGDVKANRTVTVEAVKSDGSVVKSAPVSLK